MAAQTFTISGRPAVRSLAIAAGVSLLGMAVLALGLVLPIGQVGIWLGLALAGIGIGLVIVTQEAARKSSVHATLTDEGFQLVSSRTTFGLPWKQVKHVAMTANSLVIRDVKRQEVSVVAPPGSDPAQLDALATAMAQRLDASRGYHNLI